MKSSNLSHHPIVASVVPEEQRLDFLWSHFGAQMMLIEFQVSHHFANLCPHYRRGNWECYDLSNGGCYLTPGQEFYRLIHPGRDFDATLSGDAAGIVATLYTFSQLSGPFEHHSFGIRLSDLFHLLRDYARHHPETRLIFRLID